MSIHIWNMHISENGKNVIRSKYAQQIFHCFLSILVPTFPWRRKWHIMMFHLLLFLQAYPEYDGSEVKVFLLEMLIQAASDIGSVCLSHCPRELRVYNKLLGHIYSEVPVVCNCVGIDVWWLKRAYSKVSPGARCLSLYLARLWRVINCMTYLGLICLRLISLKAHSGILKLMSKAAHMVSSKTDLGTDPSASALAPSALAPGTLVLSASVIVVVVLPPVYRLPPWYPLPWYRLPCHQNLLYGAKWLIGGLSPELPLLGKLREVIVKPPALESLVCKIKEASSELTSFMQRKGTCDRTASPWEEVYFLSLLLLNRAENHLPLWSIRSLGNSLGIIEGF